jgi:hypothetical protein
MCSKAIVLASVKNEAKILKHLLTQVPAGAWDYRPTPAQRSTLELVRYLAIGAAGATDFAVTGTWDAWGKLDEAAKTWQPADFPKAIDRQVALVKKTLAAVTDRAFATKKAKHWSGKSMPLGEALLDMVIKPGAAYRMQLFLYLKSAGAAHLTTSDVWQGKAAKPKKEKAAAAT